MVSRITAGELAEVLDSDASRRGDDGGDAGTASDDAADADDADREFTLVDTRTPDSFDEWHLPGAENVPYDPTEGFDADHREAVEDAAAGDPVVVICGKGLTSTPFGIHLADAGYESTTLEDAADVTVVRGGMEAWSTVHERVDATDGDGDGGRDAAERGNAAGYEAADLVVRQLQRRGTGCLGYVIGDRAAGEAVVVDPTRQTDEFAVDAEREGLTITAVLDTHVHADHLSGGPELAAELGVPYRVGVDVDDPTVEHPYDTLTDGEIVSVGDVELRAIHAPGHTEEMVNFVVDDAYLLSADTLHVDSVGRTELAFGEDRAEEGAELLFESLHDRLLDLDDDLTVLPGHVSVTEDNRYEVDAPGEPIRKRLGDVRENVDVLGLDRGAFVEAVTEDLPEKPGEYETIIAVNARKESVESEEDAAELETGPNSCSA